MRYLLAAALLTLSALGVSAKDKYDEANFPLIAHVTTSDVETVQTGATISKNQNFVCNGPQDSALVRAVCAGQQTRVENTSVERSLVTVEIGDLLYKLYGRVTLMPGDYRTRQTKRGFEVLCRKNDGKWQIAKYWIRSVGKR